jgi:UDP-N-acetylmuramyl tripeptide synthase
MRPRLSAALMAGRAAAVLSRRLGRGGGTVIAGHLVPRIAPEALRDVTRALPYGSIIVSGTNGKTTTTRLLSHILRGAGLRPIHNRAGANLLSGLFTAVAQATDWQGRPVGDIGLFEVDEATIPAALQHIQPRVLLLHNIFRDQLDRYGEVHFVANLWQQAIGGLPQWSTVLVNADDPLVAGLSLFGSPGPPPSRESVAHGAEEGSPEKNSSTESVDRTKEFSRGVDHELHSANAPTSSTWAEGSSNVEIGPPSRTKKAPAGGSAANARNIPHDGPSSQANELSRGGAAASGGRAQILSYGIADTSVGELTLPHAADARLCPLCGAALRYALVFYGHLGHYECSRCDFARPAPTVSATNIELLGDDGSNLTISTPEGVIRARLHLPGLYNVYNALAAIAVCSAIGIRREHIVRGLDTFTAAFGRLERIQVEDRQLFLALVKNPVGFTEVLRTVLGQPGRRTLLIAINDLFADGTDVSWLWDVEFERLRERTNVVVCSGLRAEDMAVRLKYAGVEPERIKIEPDLRRALERALAAAEPNETVYALPTYTAMLALRDILRQTGYVRGFWED